MCLERPRFEYSPAHTYALVDMANAGKLLMPRGLFKQVASARTGLTGPTSAGDGAGVPPLAWWDTARCMVHGKFDATVFGGARRFIDGAGAVAVGSLLLLRGLCLAIREKIKKNKDAIVGPVLRGEREGVCTHAPMHASA